MSVYYGVLIVSYRTATVKKAIEGGKQSGRDTESYSVESAYFGEDEAQAMAAFYRASRKAMHMPLAFSVQVWGDGEMLVRVAIEH